MVGMAYVVIGSELHLVVLARSGGYASQVETANGEPDTLEAHYTTIPQAEAADVRRSKLLNEFGNRNG